jgi:amino acid adenylation domain-containing protein
MRSTDLQNTDQKIAEFGSVVELLQQRAIEQPELKGYTFLSDGEQESADLTYQELDIQAQAIAQQLQALGILPGERALLLFPPGIEFIAAFLGCLYAGVVAVPAYPPHLNRPTPRLQAIVADARPQVALTTSQILAQGDRLFTHAPELAALSWLATDILDDKLAQNWQQPHITSNTLAFLQYTSGSTSTPKGVMVTHGNLLHNERLIKMGFQHNEQSVVVGWLPLFHDMGLIGNVLQPLYLGIPCILMPPVAFLQSPVRWLQAISRYRGTTSGGPNFAYELCLNKITPQQRETLDLSSWQVAFNGAEPVRAETLEQFARTFAPCGFRPEAFYPCYGMAETTLIISGGSQATAPVIQTVQKEALEQHQIVLAQSDEAGDLTLDQFEKRTGQMDSPNPDGEAYSQSKSPNPKSQIALVGCGQPLEKLQVVIAHPQTLTQCAPDEVGEIWVAGESVAQGYWNRPQETQRVFHAYLKDSGARPFFRTGDLGFFQNNELFITGRLKDLIIIRGRNHYPQDIESTVEQSHPSVQANCVAAFSLDIANEERLIVAAEIRRSHLRHLEVEAGIAAIRQAVAENHELQVYAVVLLKPGQIPKTSSGKIQRHACRSSFLAGNWDVIGSNTLESTSIPEIFQNMSRETLFAIAPSDRDRWLQEVLQHQVARVLKISSLSIEQPLTALGLDSLMAVELKNTIETQLGVVLSMTSLLEGASIAELVTEILENLNSEIEPICTNKSTSDLLSYNQRSLWFMQQLAPESAAYNIAQAVRISSEIDIAALRRAFQALIDRHQALRTSFSSRRGEPFQEVREDVEVWFQLEDATTWTNNYLNQCLLEETHRPFNLEEDRLMRVYLWQRKPQEYILLVVLHHIVADFWSLAVIVEELGKLYQAERTGILASLPPLALDYKDYTGWQSQILATSPDTWEYWQQQLAGELPILQLPIDRPRPPTQTYRGATVSWQITPELTGKLKALSRQEGATLYMTLLAAFQVLLYRYTGQEDILVGSPTAGRSQAELAGIVGYFVNPVVLRADLAGNPTFDRFLARVRQTALNAFAHQDYPVALLAEKLQPVRDPSRSPLFQTMFVWQKAPLLDAAGLTGLALGKTGARMLLGDLEVESFPLEQRVAQFDLTLMMAEVAGELIGTWEYNADLFEATTIERMATHFQTLLEGIATDPKQQISSLPLLTPTQQHQLLVEWNDTQTDYPQDKCIHELFAKQVEQNPNAIAVVFEEQQLTYQELNCRANRLAHHLQALGVKPEVLVGICVERSLEMVVGILAILKAGGAYVPLDPAYPLERLSFMVTDAQISILLTQQSIDLQLPVEQTIYLDTETFDVQPTHNPIHVATSDDLAYIIYTSGSTGQPKGVAISHQSIVNRLTWGIEQYQLHPGDRLFQKTSFSFDVSVWEIFGTLLAGATLVVARPGGHQDPTYLVKTIAQQQITHVDFVPAMLKYVLDLPQIENCTALRYVTCGGESLPGDVRDRFFEKLPQVQLHNCYGPTEVSIDATTWVCDRNSPIISIGRPIANQQVYILDSHLQPVPIGVTGEIYIGGAGLALGYLNRPDLTTAKFINNPFSSKPGARLYRTGDLARFLPDGNIEFLGRVDNQVKIRGFRVEIGEITALLQNHPSVKEATVVVENDPANQRSIAYISPKEADLKTEFWASMGEYPLYDELMYHAMTNDWERNQCYRQTIDKLVRGKVVVEIGTGQDAILARFCIEAGAKKVYAIEAGKEAYDRAVTLVKRLGLAEKIIVLFGYSTDLELPEPADVCVSEIIGTIGGSEGVAVILNDARRFLKPHGSMIPHRCLTKIAAISLPNELILNPGFQEVASHYVRQIFEHIGSPFDLRLCLKNFPLSNVISDSAIFEDLDFSDRTPTEYSQTIQLQIAKAGQFDGFLLWLNLYTDPDTIINNLEQESSNWLPVYFPIFNPGLEVLPGDVIIATCSGQLSDNHIHPDYRISGSLMRQNGEIIAFNHDSQHHTVCSSPSPLFKLLFPNGELKLIPNHQQLSTQNIRTYLSRYLPDYMVPSAFVSLHSLPRSPNGKLDYQALPIPDRETNRTDTVFPKTPLEKTIADIWLEILPIESVSIHDNFFDLGGHSLLAIQVNSRIREIFNIELPLTSLFTANTLEKLVQLLITQENNPGQVEKIAQIVQQINSMSDGEIEEKLHQKQKRNK